MCHAELPTTANQLGRLFELPNPSTWPLPVSALLPCIIAALVSSLSSQPLYPPAGCYLLITTYNLARNLQ